MAELKAALIGDVRAAQEALRERVAAMGDGDWARECANPGWTNKDLLAHMASIDRRLRDQLPCAFGREPWPSSTIDEYNEVEVGARRAASVDELRAELARESATTVAFLEGLSEVELAHQFEHPRRGSVTVEGFLRIIPNHIHEHVADFRAG